MKQQVIILSFLDYWSMFMTILLQSINTKYKISNAFRYFVSNQIFTYAQHSLFRYFKLIPSVFTHTQHNMLLSCALLPFTLMYTQHIMFLILQLSPSTFTFIQRLTFLLGDFNSGQQIKISTHFVDTQL